MALAQTNQVIPNEYNVAPPRGKSGPPDSHADSPDWGLSAKKAGIGEKLAQRLHLTTRRRRVFFVGLLFVGGLLLIGTVAALWGQTSAQQMSMNPAAERYWRSLTIAQVEKDLKGWSRNDLAQLFVTVRGQTSDPETRRNIDFLGRTLSLPGFTSSSSLLSALFTQPIFLLGIFLSVGIWGAAIVISIAPYVRRAPAPVLPAPTLLMPSEQPADAVLEELLPDVTLEAAPPDAPKKEEEEEKKNEEPATEEAEEEGSSGLGDLASLFEEEDTSLSALETFCKNLADITIDDLMNKAKELARDLRASIAQNARRPQEG